MIEYTSEAGYRGVLYGASGMIIFGPDGREVLHTGRRTPNTLEELKTIVDHIPKFLENLNRTNIDNEQGEDEECETYED